MKNINNKIFSNKTKHVETEEKLTYLFKKVLQISTEGYLFFSGKMCFTGDHGHQNVFSIFTNV